MARKLMLIEFSVQDDRFIAVAEQPPELFFEPIPIRDWLETAVIVAVIVAVCVGWWAMLVGGLVTGRYIWTLAAVVLLPAVTGGSVAYLKWKGGKP